MKILLFIFLGFVASAYSLHISGFVKGKPMRHYLEEIMYPEIRNSECGYVREYNFTAKVDNFNESNTDTWDQVRRPY